MVDASRDGACRGGGGGDVMAGSGCMVDSKT